MIRTFLNCSSSSLHGATAPAVSSSFGPYCASRLTASAPLSPDRSEVSSPAAASSTSRPYHALAARGERAAGGITGAEADRAIALGIGRSVRAYARALVPFSTTSTEQRAE
jgi:hypothetical protein